MVIILTHADGDGICSAALMKMIKRFKTAEVIFTHPMGLVHDLAKIEDDLYICDIAVDVRTYGDLCDILNKIMDQGYKITYLDHHSLPGPLPSRVISIHDEKVCATEIVFRYFYEDLPKGATHIALIGAICDYLDDTPLMKLLSYNYERRTLFFDAGILAQGIKPLHSQYDQMRELVEEFGNGKYPCEIKQLTKGALTLTREDKQNRLRVLHMYKTFKNLAYVVNPPASKSKAAHWIMGDAEKIIGIAIFHKKSRNICDMTIRGRKLVDLRTIVPKIAQEMGGSGGGHANACGARIPLEKEAQFLKILDNTLNILATPVVNVATLLDYLPEGRK